MEVKVSDSNFKQEVMEADKPVLTDFWAEWCGPCYKVAPVVEEIANKYKDKLKVCKINVEEAPQTASQFGIMSIPTLAIFKDSKVMDQIVGVLGKPELESKIKPYLE